MPTTKRATVYLDASLHRALRVKALETDQSMSALVNAAVRATLAEDADDLSVARARAMELERLPDRLRRQLAKRTQALANNLRPVGGEKPTGEELYRLRQGDHRIVYAIEDAVLIVRVVRIGNRRDVYR